jgi:hypothetical protein
LQLFSGTAAIVSHF